MNVHSERLFVSLCSLYLVFSSEPLWCKQPNRQGGLPSNGTWELLLRFFSLEDSWSSRTGKNMSLKEIREGCSRTTNMSSPDQCLMEISRFVHGSPSFVSFLNFHFSRDSLFLFATLSSTERPLSRVEVPR